MSDSTSAPALTIQEFYAARLDEDQRRAEEAIEVLRRNEGAAQLKIRDRLDQMPAAMNLHWYKWNPARVLREVATKRAVLHQHGAGDGGHECPDGFMDSAETEPHTGFEVECATIRILAAVYSDHPDWREEWRWSL